MADLPGSVSIVIPCYNEVETIDGVLDELLAKLADLTTVRWEVIVVDDGSDDGTAAVVAGMTGVSVIRHPMNRGYGAALKTGIKAATGEYVVTMDADGQHNPDDLPRLVDGVAPYAMSAGRRAMSSGVPLARRPGKWVLARAMNYLSQTDVPDINCGFRAMHRETILRYLHVCADRFSFSMSSTLALLSEGHFVRFVDVWCRPRKGNVSRVRVFTAFDALLTLLRLTTVFHPFRVFLPISLGLGAMGVAVGTYDVTQANISDSTVLLLISSLLVLLFGLVSDQIAHVRRETSL